MFCRHQHNRIAHLRPPDHGDAEVASPTRLGLLKQTLAETGQTMSEYAVVLGVVVIAAVVSIGLLSTALRENFFTNVASTISGLAP